ncbi:TPA: hypothetical protein ACGO1T_001437 [Streptococcus suis]
MRHILGLPIITFDKLDQKAGGLYSPDRPVYRKVYILMDTQADSIQKEDALGTLLGY